MASKLDRYKCQTNKQRITISTCPNRVFIVNPDEDRVIEGVYVVFYNMRWYLVSNSLISQGIYVDGVLRADIFEGMDSEGKCFLLLSTYPLKQDKTLWRKSVNQIVDMAREDWVAMKRLENKDGWQGRVKNNIDHTPKWPKQRMDDFVLEAFDRHIFDNEDDLPIELTEPKKPKKSNSRVIEEDD